MLYRRLFPTKLMKASVNVVGLIVILWAACGILSGCFTCMPTRKLWLPTTPGACMDLGKYYYGLQIPNIVTDAIILVMPMHTVWKLPISRTQKMGLSGIFVLGFLYASPNSPFRSAWLTVRRTLIFDIVRLVALIDLSREGNDITCKFKAKHLDRMNLTSSRQPSQLQRLDLHRARRRHRRRLPLQYAPLV